MDNTALGSSRGDSRDQVDHNAMNLICPNTEATAGLIRTGEIAGAPDRSVTQPDINARERTGRSR